MAAHPETSAAGSEQTWQAEPLAEPPAKGALPGRAEDKLNVLIQECLQRQPGLWSALDAYERNLRCRCLRGQLVREALAKYAKIAVLASGSWEAWLRTPSGQQRLARWVEKKAREAQEKQTNRAR